jgi:hypothetical protein
MWMNTEIIALSTSAKVYYTPWFPKGADNAVFTMERLEHTFGTSALAVTVYHKNREDEGSAPGSAVATFTNLSGTSFYEASCTGLKELVRFRLAFTASAVGQGVILRFLAPTWYSTAV